MGSPPEKVTPSIGSVAVAWKTACATSDGGMWCPSNGCVAALKQFRQLSAQPWNQTTARRPGPLARLAAIIACSSMTRPLLTARVTLFLTLGALVARRLPVFLRYAIAAAEIFGHLRATVVPETSQIDGAVPVFVNHDCDSFGLHTASYRSEER